MAWVQPKHPTDKRLGASTAHGNSTSPQAGIGHHTFRVWGGIEGGGIEGGGDRGGGIEGG
jgi:hypothetical protein